MKKAIVFILLISAFTACSDYELKKMEDQVRSHIKYRDQEKGIITKIDYLKAISYDQIAEEDKKDPDDAYLCKVYVRGTWAYYESNRIFNMDDTLKCVFDKSKTIVRIEETPK